MKILYIEDDVVDQMVMNRLISKTSHTLLIAKSIKEALDQLQQYNFDLIIADYYLGDGTSDTLLSTLQNQTIILITEQDIYSFPPGSNTIQIAQKPITLSVINSLNSTQVLDLTYFNSLTEGDITFQKELLDIALLSLPLSLQELISATEALDFNKIKFESHKMKSGFRVVGANGLQELEEIESIAIQQNAARIQELVKVIKLKTEVNLDLIRSLRLSLQ